MYGLTAPAGYVFSHKTYKASMKEQHKVLKKIELSKKYNYSSVDLEMDLSIETIKSLIEKGYTITINDNSENAPQLLIMWD